MKNLCLALLMMVLGGCGNENPEQVANRFIQSLIEGKTQDAYNMLSKSDQEYIGLSKFTEMPFGESPEVKSFDELFDASNQNPSSLFGSPYNRGVRFKVISSEQHDESATINLNITGVDLAALVMGALADIQQLAKKSKDEVAQSFEEKIENGDFPTKTVKWKLHLVREDGDWLVLMNYHLMDKKKEDIKAKELAIKNTYISQIEIVDFEAKYHKTWRGGKVPGYSFDLKNNSDKSFSAVKVTVYFEDKNGLVFFEKTVNPLSEILKPNYIHSMAGRYYSVEEVSKEWSGKATAKITDIEFAKAD